MRILLLFLFLVPASACLNDVTTKPQEAEFRAAYKDLPPAPVDQETQSMISTAGGFALGLTFSLVGVLVVWRILRDRA
jgi:hypothetical protein